MFVMIHEIIAKMVDIFRFLSNPFALIQQMLNCILKNGFTN